MSCQQRIIDRGYADRIKEIDNLHHLFTKVGFPENAEPGTGSRTMVVQERNMSEVIRIAAIHEFGAPKANIPERSFVRSSFDENFQGLQDFKKEQARLVIAGKQTAMVGIMKIGEWLTNKIKIKINSNVPPPLKQMTIDRKGSSKSLIDTAQMLNSVQHVEEYRK